MEVSKFPSTRASSACFCAGQPLAIGISSLMAVPITLKEIDCFCKGQVKIDTLILCPSFLLERRQVVEKVLKRS